MIYTYKKWDENLLKLGIYSVYYNNNSPEYREYQKKVFDKFNLHINQIQWEDQGYIGHSNFMNHIARTEEVDYLIFFDIDCIPLVSNILDIILERIHNKKTILGPEQTSNHISEVISKGIFAAPSCFCISKQFYKELGEPSFEATYRGDVAQELTHICREKNYKVEYFKYDRSIEEKWKLKEDTFFGSGTVYEDIIFHNFSATSGYNLTNFIEKAEEVLCSTQLRDFVDKIYYINLDQRQDRKIDTISELKKFNLYDKSERISAIKGSRDKEFSYGSIEYNKTMDALTKSHLLAVQKAVDLDLDKILIFEDDIQFLEINSEHPFKIINRGLADLQNLTNWDIVYLGGTVYQDSIVLESPNLMKAGNILGSHAYILNKRAFKKLLKGYTSPVPADLHLHILPNKYSIYPGPAVQRDGTLDDNGKNILSSNAYNRYIGSYLDKPIKNTNIVIDTDIFNIDYKQVQDINVQKVIQFLKHENEKTFFTANPGQEPYKLLMHLSSQYDNIDIIDIGTNTGVSAVALSFNPTNRVFSFDLVNKLDLLSTPSNCLFYIENICTEKYTYLIKYSKLIYIDIVHNGEEEKILTEFIVNTGFKGLILYDDIRLNEQMRQFFKTIPYRKKDITHLGHWSGTGIIEIK